MTAEPAESPATLKCPAGVVARRILEQIGGFNTSVTFSIDWDMWLRVTITQLGYIHRPSLLYRVHPESGGSGTLEAFAGGEVVNDIISTLHGGLKRLPGAARKQARQDADAFLSGYADNISYVLQQNERHRVALKYSLQAWRVRPSMRQALHVLQSAMWWLRRNMAGKTERQISL